MMLKRVNFRFHTTGLNFTDVFTPKKKVLNMTQITQT